MKTILPFITRLIVVVACLYLPLSSFAQPTLLIEPNRVTTFAGSTAGYFNATGTNAQFSLSTGVAADTFGNVFVADYNNNVIRKINAAGVVTTLAGNGTYGFADGPAASAMFKNPTGLACDLAGNVYVADQFNNRIRKVTPAGVVSTFAGDGFIGTTDGAGNIARFNFPTGVAVDAAGNVYVADQYNHRIRKVSPSAVVSTVCGSVAGAGYIDGISSVAQFNLPTGIAVDPFGNIYVADYNNHVIRKVTSGGFTSTIAGTGASGFKDSTSTLSLFSYPSGLFADALGDVYVADKGNNRIRKISSNGLVSTYAGDGVWGTTDGAGGSAQFANPYSIIKNRYNEIYIADANNNRIRKMAAPNITAFSTPLYIASASQNITIGGRNLISVVEVKAPTGYEVSLSATFGYLDSLEITPQFGEISTTIHFRLKANTVAGTYNGNVIVRATSASDQLIAVTGTVNCLPITISPVTLNAGSVGYTYTQNLTQTGLNFPTWRVGSGSLPSGLSLDSVTGVISGIPSALGLFNFSIKAVEGNCEQTRVYAVNMTGTPLSRWVYSGLNCTTRDVQFKDSSILATSWRWEFGDGFTSTLQNPLHIYAKDSVYTVKLIINGNADTSEQVISIATSASIPAITAVPSCNFVYSFKGAPAMYGYQYYWSFDIGSTGSADTLQTPTRSYPVSGSTTVNLTIVSQGKCLAVATPLVFNASAQTVGVTADMDISSILGNGCLNQRVLTNMSTGSGTTFAYSLDGGSFVSYSTPVILTALSNGLHTIKFAANDLSCYDTATQSFPISGAVAAFTNVPSICNQTVQFTNTSTQNYGSATYFWAFGSPLKGTSTLQNPNFDFGTPGVDTVSLTINTTSGCSNTVKLPITVGSGTGPNPSFSTSFMGGTCSNFVQFSNNTSNGTGATYYWDFGDGTNSTDINTIRGYGDTGYFLVTLNASTPGCSLSYSQNVYIPDSAFGPSAKFTINSKVQNINTQSFNFYNFSKHLNPAKGFNTKYYWSFGDGTIDSVNNSIYNKKYTLPGTYTVTLSAKNNLGCIDIYSQQVTVNQILTAKFGYDVNSCNNRYVQFHDSSTLATRYYWQFGDGDTSTFANPSHTYTRDSTYTVRLTVNGTVLYTQTITVATFPTVGTITQTHNCDNVYTFFGPASGNGLSYFWTFGAGSSGPSTTVQNPIRYYSVAGTSNVSLNVLSYGRCAVSAPTYTFTPLLYQDAAVARVSVSAPSGNLCGNARIITNNSNAGLTYTYSLDTNTFATIGSSITLNNISTGLHYVRIAAHNGVCFDTAYAEFHISNALPAFTSTPSICNQVVSFTSYSSSTDNGGLSYAWSFGRPQKGSSVDVHPSFNFGTPGVDSVSLTVTSSSGCSNTTKQAVTVGSGTTTLVAGFKTVQVPGLCENKFEFIDTTKGGTNITYNWDFGDGSSSDLKNPVKSFSDTGNFIVTLTSSIGGCFSAASHPVYISPNVFGPSASFSVSKNIQPLNGNSFNFINQSSNLSYGYIAQYYWRLGDGTLDSTHNSIYSKNYTVADTFDITLIAVSSTGCIDSTSNRIIITPQAMSKFGVVLNTCTNRQVQFLDSSSLATSYYWQFGDGDTSILASPSHSYTHDGYYDVTLTINGALSYTRKIFVVSNPTAQYTLTSNNCSNEFKFQSNDLGSTYTYQWHFSNGTASDTLVANPVLNFSAITTTLVDLSVTSGGRCTIKAPQDTIYSQVGVRAAAYVSSADFCGTTRTVNNTSVGGNAFYISMDGSAYAVYTAPVTYNNLGYGNHVLRFIATDGICSDTLETLFKVNSLTGAFTSRSSNCTPSVEFFSSMVSADASEISYVWNFAGEGNSIEANPLFLFSSTGKRYVSLTASSTSGCSKFVSDSVQVNSSIGPVSTFTASEIKTTPCQTGFNFVSTSPNATQFYWQFGDGLVSNQGPNTSTFHAYLDTGVFYATMVAINNLGCSTVSDTLPVRVTTAGKPSPVAGFSVNDSVQCLSFQSFNFINTSTLEGAGYLAKFTWSLGDGNKDSVNNSVFGKRYGALGSYTINLTATTNLGCSNTYSRTVRVVSDLICNPLGLAAIEAKEINLYPNPNAGMFSISLNKAFAGTESIRILDLLGREVVLNQAPVRGSQTLELNLHLQAGKYYVEIQTAEGETLRKSFVVLD
ncbi:MAG: hypothetical protein CFE21_11625 [Bacteroidetes bacterium B1(2017)]|nr:MAG: hypothetical protein CFE21_11625 [Bacteroidetes bacterium B1(2017)]